MGAGGHILCAVVIVLVVVEGGAAIGGDDGAGRTDLPGATRHGRFVRLKRAFATVAVGAVLMGAAIGFTRWLDLEHIPQKILLVMQTLIDDRIWFLIMLIVGGSRQMVQSLRDRLGPRRET